jgi:hypothetical protein
VREVQAWFASLPGNLRRAAFSAQGVDGRNGMTVSIWRTDEEMTTAAYGPGYHRAQIDHQRAFGIIDYSSFTRTRILASRVDGTAATLP